MPVKHWSAAGLMLTDWCSARCSTCYLRCGPDGRERMGVDRAVRIWGELVAASPHGCRVHLTGGEPFGDWPGLIELCRRGRGAGLGPLEKVETNAFWATDEAVARQRVSALDAAAMDKLVISADPYHQQYVPIARCRLLARVAAELLGAGRVQVRWRDWLAEGSDTDALDAAERGRLFVRYAAGGRDRLNGRAAETLAPHLTQKPISEFADTTCGETLLRSKHVHVEAGGAVMPGVCAGVVVGDARQESVGRIWQRLCEDHADRPVLAALAARGPTGLIGEAEQTGFRARRGYASKCHLCWDVRKHLARSGRHEAELGPARLYEGPDPLADAGAAADSV